MKKPPGKKAIKIDTKAENKYVLRLYVAGANRRSFRAIQNLRKMLDEHLSPDEYELEIIDIYQQPIFAKKGQIIAAPTLIKELPEPLQRFIGDLSNIERLLVGMDVERGADHQEKD